MASFPFFKNKIDLAQFCTGELNSPKFLFQETNELCQEKLVIEIWTRIEANTKQQNVQREKIIKKKEFLLPTQFHNFN